MNNFSKIIKMKKIGLLLVLFLGTITYASKSVNKELAIESSDFDCEEVYTSCGTFGISCGFSNEEILEGSSDIEEAECG